MDQSFHASFGSAWTNIARFIGSIGTMGATKSGCHGWVIGR